MLFFLPWPLLVVLNALLLALNAIICATPMIILAPFKLIPLKFVRRIVDAVNHFFYRFYILSNSLIIRLTNRVKFEYHGDKVHKTKGSCMIVSNHLSWLDILIIGHIYKGKVPITKFFLKQNLIYIPFVGIACWCIGMPFLKRYTRAQILKNPSLKDKDIETTKKACASLIDSPSTLINFSEGTRFTAEKALKSKSPYKHLMQPKPASVAVVLNEIGRDLDCVFNTTIHYDGIEKKAFWAMLKGNLRNVFIHIDTIKITDDLIGDYLKDREFKQKFTNYMRNKWLEKDAILEQHINPKNEAQSLSEKVMLDDLVLKDKLEQEQKDVD